MKKFASSALILLIAAAGASATVHNVPSALYPTIQAGIDSASAGDTVAVAAGVYSDLFYPPGADTARCVVYMKSDIVLMGAGTGSTIIDALAGGRGIYCYGVTGARIEDLTVRNAFSEEHGAGLYCFHQSSIIVESCEITSCDDGGVIVRDNSDLDMRHSEITDNGAKQGGGLAIELHSTGTVTACTIMGNYAPVGGGMYVRISSSTVTMDSCVVDSNYLSTINGTGGGIGLDNAALTMTNSSVNGNVSSGKGGGLWVFDSSVFTAEDTRIQGNQATGDTGPGGGLYAEFSDLVLTRCTVTGNSCMGESSDGGGIYMFFSTASSFTGCTIAHNGTAGTTGGIVCRFASPPIDNTIIAFNSPGNGMACPDGGNPTVTCCDLYGNDGGDAICGTDGGDNFSREPFFCDADNGDYSLKDCSACLPGQHPESASCGLIGALGQGSCSSCTYVGVDDAAGILPPMRHYASPNPFGPATTIHFTLNRPEKVDLAVYDIRGRTVKHLESKVLSPGEHLRTWDATDDAGRRVSSGVYFYRLGGSGVKRTGRLILTR